MTYAKNSTITAIHRPITNGMYNDTYTVIYSNGIRRNYTIKGAMNKKHFEFIQSATVESKYSKHTGKHTADIFTAPAEPKEEPTTEEQAAEVQTAEVQATEEATEEATQEDEPMRFKKDYFAVSTKKIDKFNAIRFDSDIEFDVTNCTEDQEPTAIRKALEKFVEELKKHGGAEILVDSLEMSLRFDEIGPECIFNEIRNGGNAFEYEINRYDDKSMSIYLRICEHQEAPKPETIKPFDELTEEEIENMIAEEVEKEYFGETSAEVPNLYRNEPDNAPEVREMLLTCSHIQFDWRRNHAVFYKCEREIGRAYNVDNMDLQKVARSLGKSYDRTW